MDTSNFYLFINNTNKQKMSTKTTLKLEWEKKKKKQHIEQSPCASPPFPLSPHFVEKTFLRAWGENTQTPVPLFPLPFPTKHPPKTSSLLLLFFSFFSLKGF